MKFALTAAFVASLLLDPSAAVKVTNRRNRDLRGDNGNGNGKKTKKSKSKSSTETCVESISENLSDGTCTRITFDAPFFGGEGGFFFRARPLILGLMCDLSDNTVVFPFLSDGTASPGQVLDDAEMFFMLGLAYCCPNPPEEGSSLEACGTEAAGFGTLDLSQGAAEGALFGLSCCPVAEGEDAAGYLDLVNGGEGGERGPGLRRTEQKEEKNNNNKFRKLAGVSKVLSAAKKKKRNLN